MKVKFAKRNPVKGTVTAYVQSVPMGRKWYIVQLVKVGRKVIPFCECRDFIARHLPHVHTNTFSGCKHGKAARRAA